MAKPATSVFQADSRVYDRQRQWPRRPTQFTVVVKYDKTMQMGTMIDVCVGGMQIRGVGGLRRGEPVEVQLVSGETYRGTAAWSSIDAVGVKFLRPLATDDKLFTAAGRIIL